MLPHLWVAVFWISLCISFNFSSSDFLPEQAESKAPRPKRQVYFTNKGVATFGEIDQDVPGSWKNIGGCSRTCGGGVQIQQKCVDQCIGTEPTRYVSCNIEDCPKGSKDFRAVQCSEKDDSILNGRYYKWIPYIGSNKCELICSPETGVFYYKWADKVIDGTRCDEQSDDICVDGICLQVGCDKLLGSAVKDDKCGVCGGNGSSCRTVEGVFEERSLSPGYHDIIKLPIGATSITVEEMRQTSNSLAIKNSSDYFYLNGNHQIQMVDRPLKIGGTVFVYESQKHHERFERLTAKGPITEELIISLLFQMGSRDAAIKYEFSVPLENEVPYFYKPTEWSECSVTCGKGVQTRKPVCIENKLKTQVDDIYCEENNATQPETKRFCETVDCQAEWYTGEWEQCSESCGNTGTQYRTVYCHQVFADGKRMTVDETNCTSERPPVQQQCNRFKCPKWHVGPWSACSKHCGEAFQYRSVTCESEREHEEGKLLPAEACREEKPQSTRSCNLGPCQGLSFQKTNWELCVRCNDTEETRNVTCRDTAGRMYPLEKCLNENETTIPPMKRPCVTQPPCIYEWHISQWSKCSTECGHGFQNRTVVCAIFELGEIKIVDDSHCDPKTEPETRKNCTSEENCTGTYFTSQWSECSEKCGGGKQTRLVVCLNYDKNYAPELCDPSKKPLEEQECNTTPCENCFDTEFGCCPDNVTISQGFFFEGCSNCSLSEFGCCEDNVTEASGPSGKGCPEYTEGSGDAEALLSDDGKKLNETLDEYEMCKDIDPSQPALYGKCLSITPPFDSGLLLGNDTESNETVHCSRTKFGCCPDWVSAAEGPNNQGCPEFILGECNETAFGCCPDNVTLARGPDHQGCGNRDCAATLYGCCEDGKNVAFGPHYKGCARPALPCEHLKYGCCPDGKTEALGEGGLGCNSSCLVSEFGCCPDGITPAEGPKNQGCGCAFAPYGCCPDGKTPAKGAGFEGCPKTCTSTIFGCCPDGKTPALDKNNRGCPCQFTQYGCCPDGETPANGPLFEGCDDCRNTKFGCCPDGKTRAASPNFSGCPTTTPPPPPVEIEFTPEQLAVCRQPIESGSCSNYDLSWGFDLNEGQCKRFWYGGCGGNGNRFSTYEECESRCISPPGKGRCYLPKSEGFPHCHDLKPRYWFNQETSRCYAFWWKGCKGNQNNFENWESCMKFCAEVGAGPAESHYQARLGETEETEERGREETLSEGFNVPGSRYVVPDVRNVLPDTRNVVPDMRGGASDSRNNIPERQEASVATDATCNLPPDTGPCRDYSTFYYYDRKSNQCYPFTYGGCHGNQNRFKTATECEQRCGQSKTEINRAPSPYQAFPVPHPRHQPSYEARTMQERPANYGVKTREDCNERVTPGTCNGSFEAYFYDKLSGQCLPFRYTGCGGSANRFRTKAHCEQICIHSAPSSASEQHMAQGSRYGRPNQAMQGIESRNGNPCTLPKVAGPCGGRHQRFYFDNNYKTCMAFEYGGCLGNANNFATLEECRARCQNVPNQQMQSLTLAEGTRPFRCYLPKEVGTCRASFVQYYYNSELDRCIEFIYGGCNGNQNRFNTMEDCQEICNPIHKDTEGWESGTSATVTEDSNGLSTSVESEDDEMNGVEELSTDEYDQMDTSTIYSVYRTRSFEIVPTDRIMTMKIPTSSLPELCLLAEETGSCYGEILRWRYDSEKSSCVSFIYTGCNHNANFFTSPEACERACGQYRDEDVCVMQVSPGHCENGITKWHYNIEAKECQVFMYSGCGGNGNRFSSKAECENLCASEQKDADKDACKMERDSGPCTDPVTQWYFDFDDGECKQFTYGGCRGNKNRFDTKLQCQERCITHIIDDTQSLDPHVVCTMSSHVGTCQEKLVKWFFDVSVGYCREFYYSGCDGNENRFDDEENCMNFCSPLLAKPQAEVRPSVELTGQSTVATGSTVQLLCVANDQRPIQWFKDEIDIGNDFNNARIQLTDDKERLTIINAKEMDSGSYSCSAGRSNLLSDPVEIIVKRPKAIKNCIDKGSETTCSLIVKVNLCGIPRYGNYCCRSCSIDQVQNLL